MGLSFEDGNLTEDLKELAKLTGGEYINAFRSEKVNKIMQIMRQKPIDYYIISYTTYERLHYFDRWREVRLDLTYNDLFGQDRTGYYILD